MFYSHSFTWLTLGALVTLATATPLPDYVLTYAPYTYLASDEAYWPSDITTHLQHVTPQINRTNVATSVKLDDLSSLGGNVFLTSKDSWTTTDAPKVDWMLSNYGKPASDGTSAGPATIIAVNKPGGIVDAFYFYFYSFDLGTTAVGIRFGNHIGDWEHSMVRFVNGKPANVYLSAHSAGTAYTYDALEKAGVRPVTYIAKGTHANYATAAPQPYPVAVIGPIFDQTSKGPIWDVTKNYRGYWFEPSSGTFSNAGGAGSGGAEQAGESANWLNSWVQWGDDTPPANILKNDQYCIKSECHYVAGPTGPIAKNLGRTQVCQNEAKCSIKKSRNVISLGNIDNDLAQLGSSLKEAHDRGLLNNVTVG